MRRSIAASFLCTRASDSQPVGRRLEECILAGLAPIQRDEDGILA